ncbi:diguanylate cyclase (GGDEF)-like protein/PAS domain S-box-containing protein [Paenibacillus phyllosphaerae]|uniref:Diguanylate cyclase (GGDEF)-like protein/PAS domain S-box-containing protein n=1 Tax=Paenibacillus phyllosphaerae TaxID=274593 RepID=A0A7W5FMV4_9BACL|nr:diguanylate cyclase [Paenibacillus phyllosphaerae]MBB3110651.1 diguanylate cyclase (GGDEF)-like protein/PAS domain S-box-containing protein [Paenibacillus phyllosphaerae]
MVSAVSPCPRESNNRELIHIHTTALLFPALNQLLPIFLLFYMAVEVYTRHPNNKLHIVTTLLFLFLSLVFLGDFLFAILPSYVAIEVLRYVKYTAVFLTLTAALYFFAYISRLRLRGLLLHLVCLAPSLGVVWLLVSPRSLVMVSVEGVRDGGFSTPFFAFLVAAVGYCFFWFFLCLFAAMRRTSTHHQLKERKRNQIILNGCLLVGCLLSVGYAGSKFIAPDGSPIADMIYAYGILAWAYAIRLSMVRYDMLSTAGKRYELLFELSPNGTVVLDDRGDIVEANGAFRKLAGIAREMRLRGLPLSALFHGNEAFLLGYRQSFEAMTPLELELELVNKAGERYEVEIRGEFLEIDGKLQSFLVMLDKTEDKNNARMLEQLAFEDVLTGLCNSRRFEAEFRAMLLDVRTHGGQLGLLLIDLDQFKWINDTLGHTAGDQLLQQVAERLQATIPPEALVARLGGDEFAILLPLVEDADEPSLLAEGLLKALTKPLVLRGTSYVVSASIGVVVAPEDETDPEVLLRQVDTAMYAAKHGGRNRFCRYTPSMNENAQEQLKLLSGLSTALEKRQFELLYQPQFDLATGQVTVLEALLHWRSPELGYVAPSRFIPLAEETGAIIPIGSWVLEEVIRQLRIHLDRGCIGLCVSVNLSASQLREAGFVDRLSELLCRYGVPPRALRLEITESTMITDMRRMHQVCKEWMIWALCSGSTMSASAIPR